MRCGRIVSRGGLPDGGNVGRRSIILQLACAHTDIVVWNKSERKNKPIQADFRANNPKAVFFKNGRRDGTTFPAAAPHSTHDSLVL